MQWTRDEVLSKAVKFRKYCSSAIKQVHFNQVKPVLEPMRCNQAQVQSGATRCNQVLPGVIRCHQVQSGAIRCNQVQSGSGAIRFRCNQVSLQSGATRCIQVQCTWNALTLHCTSLKITTFSLFPTDQICHQAFQEIFRPSSWYLIPLIRWEISLTKREGKINSLKKLFDSSEGLTWHRGWSQKGFHEL